MNEWIYLDKEKPEPGKLVHRRVVSEQLAWYEPDCKLFQWLKPKDTEPNLEILWRYASYELEREFGVTYDEKKPKED